MLYESLLLFGVIFITDAMFDIATGSRHALKLHAARQIWLFLVIGAYFTFLWCRSGQTLAMKTWRIRVVSADGSKLGLRQAALRYLLAWMWWMPGLMIDYLFGLKAWPSVLVVVVGALCWLAATVRDEQRQFLHDRLAGTRLIDVTKIAGTAALRQ
jgi:uncharacterized RDD family membrane protein YckC